MQLQAASILFVDNPVGTGFSYVDDCSLFAKNLTTVVSDMMVFLKEFFTHRTEFQVGDLSYWLESYFSLQLNRSQKELVSSLLGENSLLPGSVQGKCCRYNHYLIFSAVQKWYHELLVLTPVR